MTHFRITLFAALLLLISCQKDPQPVNPSSGNDPIVPVTPADTAAPVTPDDTITPAIITPDIHDFMPSTLLNLFGEENIHQGNTPPDITGSWLADSLCITEIALSESSNYSNLFPGMPLGDTYFTFRDFGQNELKTAYFIAHNIASYSYTEYSNMDTTAFLLKEHENLMINNPLLPSCFQDNSFDFSLFDKAYIIGSDDQFTVYFYDVTLLQISEDLPFHPYNFQPVSAKIISGKALRDQNGNVTGIADFRVGQEVVGYVKDGNALQISIQQGLLPTPGDAWIKTNQGIDLTYSEFSLE